MPVTLQGLFYATYTVLAAGLIVLAMAGAWSGSREPGRHAALAATVGGTLLLVVFGAITLAHRPGLGFLHPLGCLLPVLCLGTLAATLRGARGLSLGSKAMALAACAWNGALAAVYALRAAHEVFHLDAGTWGPAVLAANALVQTNIGDRVADRLPVYFFLPILLLPGRLDAGAALLIRGTGGLLACFMTTLMLAALPGGRAIARQDEPDRGRPVAIRPDLRLALVAGDPRLRALPDLPDWLTLAGNTPAWSECVRHARELGIDTLDIPVAADAIQGNQRFGRLQAMVSAARRADLGVTLSVQPPDVASPLTPRRFQELMEEAQWFLSEHLEPDLLVLYPRPAGSAMRARVGELPASAWLQMVEASARALRKAQPGQRLAVDLDPPTSAAREALEKLSRFDSPLDEIRFVVDTGTRPTIEIAGWLASNPTRLRIALVAASIVPLGQGGFAAQIDQVERLAAFAAEQPLIVTFVLGQMLDDDGGLAGFWDNRGQPRPVVPVAHELVRQLRGL